ncbi:MAG: hypothetical protein LBR91_01865 [Puniceicoccales bacterium]|jgi:hypothetical protein|nr:hypothetical protein [Puniceicoccales bacterium]
MNIENRNLEAQHIPSVATYFYIGRGTKDYELLDSDARFRILDACRGWATWKKEGDKYVREFSVRNASRSLSERGAESAKISAIPTGIYDDGRQIEVLVVVEFSELKVDSGERLSLRRSGVSDAKITKKAVECARSSKQLGVEKAEELTDSYHECERIAKENPALEVFMCLIWIRGFVEVSDVGGMNESIG